MKSFILMLFIFLLNYSANSQVVINEICPDPGNYDGQGAEWTELYNTGSSAIDLSCWVLTNGESIVVFPTGSYIPANGFTVIYNSNFFNPTNNTGNWYSSISNRLDNNGTLISPDPDGVTSIDLASCGCTNKAGCFPVSWSNPSGNNGTDRIVLFNSNAVIQDAIYYGIGDNYTTAASKILENTYATGPNTLNRNITGSASGCNLPASKNYDIPALPTVAGTNDAIWKYAGNTITGCTTTKSRSTDGGSTWIDDNWPTPGASNTNPDYKITYTLNGTSPVDISNSANDNITINVCSGAIISFNAEVYDYNQVFNTNAGDIGLLEGGSSRGGTHIIATGGLTFDSPWNEATVTTAATIAPPTLTSDGMTSLNFPTTSPMTTNTTFKIYIKENTSGGAINVNNSCGSGNIIGTGTASECYILKTINVNIVNPIVSASINCNASTGISTVTTVPSTNIGSLIFQLYDGTILQQSNSTGIFQVSTAATTGYTIKVYDNCGNIISATGTICVFFPPCPKLVLSSTGACAVTPSGNKCPGDIINLGIDLSSVTGSSNLTNGSIIEFYKGTTSNFDPSTSPISNLIATSTVTVTAATALPGGSGTAVGCPYISGIMVDACNGSGVESDNEFITLQNGNSALSVNNLAIDYPSNTDITTISNTDFAAAGGFTGSISLTNLQPASCPTLLVGLTNGGTIPANATVIIFNSTKLTQNYDFSGMCGLGTVYILIVNATPGVGTFSNNGGRSTVLSTTTCSAKSYSYTTALASGGDGTYVSFAGQDPITVAAGNSSGVPASGTTSSASGGCSGPSLAPSTTNVTCATYSIPSSECNNNGNLYFKGIVKPKAPSTCLSPTNGISTTSAGPYSVTCPTATISGQKAICSGSSTNIDVSLANYGTNSSAIVTYLINGTNSTTTASLPIINGKVTIPNITIAGIYTLSSITFNGGGAVCNGSINGDVTISVATTPNQPTTATTIVCANLSSPISVTNGGPTYNWYSDAALTNLVGVGNPYYYSGTGTTLYVTSNDPDNSCSSSSSNVVITSTPPPVLTIPASINCGSGSFLQNATGGTGTLTFTLSGLTGGIATTSTIGSSNTTGSFNLGGTTGATILVTDANGCYQSNTYNFLASPYNCVSALPLNFIYFNATVANNKVTLNWKVDNELNIINYNIERSINGINFESIGFVIKNNTSQNNYLFTDNNIQLKKYYYRIKAITNQNNSVFSTIKSISINKEKDIQVTPNPTSNFINLNLQNFTNSIIKIFDANGKLYYEQKTNVNNINIEVKNWASSTYFIKVEDLESKEIINSSFIKK